MTEKNYHNRRGMRDIRHDNLHGSAMIGHIFVQSNIFFVDFSVFL